MGRIPVSRQPENILKDNSRRENTPGLTVASIVSGMIKGRVKNWIKNRMRGRTLTSAGILLGLLLLANWAFNARRDSLRDLPPESGPVVLTMQKIGQLHTAAFTMKDVVRQETQAEPEGLVSYMPGASTMVHWATHNQALIVAEGKVEAGIDLSKIAAKDVTQVARPDGTKIWRVHLPPVIIYPPHVTARVEQNSAGMLWRDENIVPKAQERASQQFLIAAEKSHIRQMAQEKAIETLQAMQHTFGREMEFYF